MSSGKLACADAVRALYTDHHHWLCRWLRSRLGCADHAADLAHETFARVIARVQEAEVRPLRLDDLREPRAFLTTIAHGLVVNHWRRVDVERAYLEALVHQPEATRPSPEARALVVETLLEIEAMLAALPEKMRRAFLMAHLDGLAYREIAGRLGVSERMVKKYMAGAAQRVEAIEQRLKCLGAVGPAARAALDAPRSPGRRRALRALGLFAGAGGAAWAALRMPWDDWRHDPARHHAAYRTARGEIRAYALADGTRIWLGSASALEVTYSSAARRLALHEGDLLVETARDAMQPPRPFTVDTRHGTLRALGTRFAVRCDVAGARVDVFEGAVELAPRDPGAAMRTVNAGEHAVFDRGGARQSGKASPARNAWARGVLLAEDLRLDALVAELARWHATPITAAPAAARLRVVGVYPLLDLDVVLAALEQSLPIEVRRGPQGIHLARRT